MKRRQLRTMRHDAVSRKHARPEENLDGDFEDTVFSELDEGEDILIPIGQPAPLDSPRPSWPLPKREGA